MFRDNLTKLKYMLLKEIALKQRAHVGCTDKLDFD